MTWQRVRGWGAARLTREAAAAPQANMAAPLKELRTALLEADVALPTVKAFLAKVEQRAAGVQARAAPQPRDAPRRKAPPLEAAASIR